MVGKSSGEAELRMVSRNKCNDSTNVVLS